MKRAEWEEALERFKGHAVCAELRMRRAWVLIGHASTPGRTDRRFQLMRAERMIVEASNHIVNGVAQLFGIKNSEPRHSELTEEHNEAVQLQHDFDELTNAWRRHIGHPVKAIECSCVQPTPRVIDETCDADHGAAGGAA